ncbi:MAG: hypothetical protein JSW14_01435 [Candidatus Bathyarchaeum sp.]|nr:MAG: hypothetical protein JSW14_01435 [Candidatus Bathyarchaeum sp.]
MHNRTKAIIIITLLVLIIQVCTLSVLASNNPNGKEKEGKGQGKGATDRVIIGIYSDNQCTNPMSSISWGMLEPGSSKNIICYIKNEGNTVLFLSLKTSNWKPRTAFKDITIDWDYGGQSLNSAEIIQVTLTLSVSDKTDFTNLNVDIIIIGSL